MPVQYTSRKGKTYYLHEGRTKTGKPKYYCSTKSEGKLLDEVPAEYEIYELPTNAQVVLRKKQPNFITDIEKHIIKKSLKNIESSRRYTVDFKCKTIIIFESCQDIDNFKGIWKDAHGLGFIDKSINLDSIIDYSPIMRFILEDETERTFIAERYCFRGSVDDWIYIGGPNSLEKITREFIKHLGKESFYELYGF